MKSPTKIQNFKSLIEDHFYNTENHLTDLEIYNADIRMNRMIGMFKSGLTNKEIKAEMKLIEEDPESQVSAQFYEIKDSKITKELIKEGYSRDSNEERDQFENELNVRIKSNIK